MPNWVFNELTIQGPKDQIDSIKDKLNSPFTRKHSNWNIEKQVMEETETIYSAPVFAFHNIYNHIEDGISDEQYREQPARSELDINDPNWWADTQRLSDIDNSWYNWNVRNWGTKWDVAVHSEDKYPDTVLHEHKSEGEDQWLVYGFNTAWSPPVEALIKLSRLVPNCVITLSWEEEQGFGGEIEFVNGNITADSGYENKCRDCGAEDTLDYCDTCDIEICSKCNYLGEADLQLSEECQTHKVYLDNIPEYRKAEV